MQSTQNRLTLNDSERCGHRAGGQGREPFLDPVVLGGGSRAHSPRSRAHLIQCAPILDPFSFVMAL